MAASYPIAMGTGFSQALGSTQVQPWSQPPRGSPTEALLQELGPLEQPSGHIGHCAAHLPTHSLRMLGTEMS